MSKFDKVVGYEDIKAELIRIGDVVKNPEKYDRLGVHMPRGVMLWGDPGVGKSLMAKCFIEESGCKSFTIRKDKPDGDLVNAICDTFAEAKAEGRAIVFRMTWINLPMKTKNIRMQRSMLRYRPVLIRVKIQMCLFLQPQMTNIACLIRCFVPADSIRLLRWNVLKGKKP